jgi:uncharacterized protein
MPTVTIATARHFMRLATGIEAGFQSIAEALQHLAFVQIDPINVCGRMQDHILRTRVVGYQEGGLMDYLHPPGPRSAFEHHLPDSQNLAALPLDAWPHLQTAMKERTQTDSLWSGKLTHEEKKLATRLLARMKDEGPLCSQDIESSRREKQHEWDSTTVAKSTLQKLFFHGRVLIAKREGIRRYYDLPEHVLPSETLHTKTPSKAETTLWLAQVKMRQRRLALLKAAELTALGSQVVPVSIEQLPKLKLHVLASDLPLLEKAASAAPKKPLLIAPLDPVIYDRKVTEQLWAFDYRWEVYVPPAKRVRGYYALPLLAGTELVGYSDLKADRVSGSLGIISHQGRGAKEASKALASFLGLRLG